MSKTRYAIYITESSNTNEEVKSCKTCQFYSEQNQGCNHMMWYDCVERNGNGYVINLHWFKKIQINQ